MSERASVSVVIPTYNHGHLVTQAVQSALLQTVVPAEVLVVDDGSLDDTRQRLAPYWNQIRYLSQHKQGVSAARNHGIRAALSEYVAFLDSDDVWHPRKLERQMEVFRRYPALGMLGTRHFDWPAAQFPDLSQRGTGNVKFVAWDRLAVRNRFVASSVVVRREILDQAGPFDTQLQGPEDRDLWLRITALVPAANVEEPLVGYRCTAGSVSKQAAVCQAGMKRILRKLDDQDAWQGRWWLRRKAYSHMYHSCAYLHSEAGNQGTAVLAGLKSLAWYPLPYPGDEVDTSNERVKQLAVNLLRLLHLKSMPGSRTDVLRDRRKDALEDLAQRIDAGEWQHPVSRV